MSEKTNKITIALINAEFIEFTDIVQAGTEEIEIDGVGTFYTERSHPRPPNWIRDFFLGRLGVNVNLLTSNAKGILLVKMTGPHNRIMAVIFGFGRHLLKPGAIEDRFGLRVVLNSVDPDSLRSIDKTALGSVPKQSREQISREGESANFGIDVEQDLINSVTGKSRIENFGRTITGRDTFAASAKFDVTDIKDFLSETLERFGSSEYRERFDWIDQIKDVRSKSKIVMLDLELVRLFAAGEFEKIWMAPPEVVDWADARGFRYLRKRSKIFADLDPVELKRAAAAQPITIDWLSASKIHLISARTDDVSMSWPSYRCIYAEINIENTMYVLNSGKWFQVADDFTDLVERDFRSTPESSIDFPEYRHDNENSYNQELSQKLHGSFCLDANLIIHGGGQSKIEFCDVLSSSNEIIHVKRYSGSAQLSHLFNQGVVAAELLVSDAVFRQKLNDKLPDHLKIQNHLERPNAEDYEIVFTIISKSANPLNLPFFSKVSLRNAKRRLFGFRYRVSIKKVRAISNEDALVT